MVLGLHHVVLGLHPMLLGLPYSACDLHTKERGVKMLKEQKEASSPSPLQALVRSVHLMQVLVKPYETKIPMGQNIIDNLTRFNLIQSEATARRQATGWF